MAVFTQLSDLDRAAIAAAYDMKRLSSIIGIADGDRETTYLFRSDGGDFIVTLFEHAAQPSDLERAFETMETLHQHDVPCPRPLRTRDGKATCEISGKLVATVTFVPGSSMSNAGTLQCRDLGRAMAKIHVVLRVDPGASRELPRGSIHGALIPQNVFFIGDKVSGIINFRLRHDDVLIAEIADAIVAWTSHAAGRLDPAKIEMLLHGYEEVRPLSAIEREALPAFVMGAAARLNVEERRHHLLPEVAVDAYRSMREALQNRDGDSRAS